MGTGNGTGSPAADTPTEVDVVVIGSGFGGAVAALRFAQAGKRVLVLERGARVSRDTHQVDLDSLWKPHRASYGFHDLRFRGKHILPWLGAAVGGGSHVYAGTLKRRDDWAGFPAAIVASDMARHFATGEEMLGVTPYPSYPPYSEVRATRLMYKAGMRLQDQEPELVEAWGPVPLGISFAPEHGPGKPGDEFVNPHGCRQRYSDPGEQSILGGDIDAKNTLDRNYLFVAEQRGARVEPLCEADRLERQADGRWAVEFRRHLPSRGWARVRQRWFTWRPRARLSAPERVIARHVVVACGAIGSSELLLRNRDVHRTLPDLGPALGSRYTTNGDSLSLIVPFRLLIPVWLAFVALVACVLLRQWIGAGVAAGAYYLGLLASGPSHEPDVGTTNSDNIRFKGPRGEPQYAYIESGRYPTPGRAFLAILISGLTGGFRPGLYKALTAMTKVLRFLVPPFGAIARTYPIPFLQMGRDRAYGRVRLDGAQQATIDFDLAANREFYAYQDVLAKKVARAIKAYWLPNPTHKYLDKLEIPHNQGGVPMAEGPADGVVDHAGRVFAYPDLMVLDGSIIPESVGPNPALTIVAVAERAMELVVAQVAAHGTITAEPT